MNRYYSIIIILFLANLFNYNCFGAQQRPPDELMGAAAKHAGQKRTFAQANSGDESEDDSDTDKRQKKDCDDESGSASESDEDSDEVSKLKQELAKLFRELEYVGFLKEEEVAQKVERIKTIFNSGIDIDFIMDDEETALTRAASFGLNELAKWLILQGADVNLSGNGFSALNNSVEHSNLELTEFLLKNGANPNVEGNDGLSALAQAIENTDLESAKILLDYGADINFMTDDGDTALFNSVKNSNLESTEFLLNYGADANVRFYGQEQGSMLFLAALGGNREIIKLLLINGAYLDKDDAIDIYKEQKKIYNEEIQEVVAQYRRKIEEYNNKVKEAFIKEQGEILPKVLRNIVSEYLIPETGKDQYFIPNYKTDKELIDNIIYIRYKLGELSPIQKEQFELKQQQQEAASAGGSSGGAAAASAAAASVAASLASQGGGGGAAASMEE